MPFLNFLSIYTFREHHPDWKIIFIKPKDEAKAEGKWDTGEHSIELVDDPEIDYSKFVGRYVDETWQFDFTELLAENLEVNDVHKADVLRPHLMHTSAAFKVRWVLFWYLIQQYQMLRYKIYFV